MAPKLIRKHCAISSDGEELLENAVTRLGLSVRAQDRILKVPRTIADLDGAAGIATKHVNEAIQYGTLDRSLLVIKDRKSKMEIRECERVHWGIAISGCRGSTLAG